MENKSEADLHEIGQRLREYRLRLNKTQPELAAELNVKRQTISSWEQGITTPDIRTLLLLKQRLSANGLVIDLSELMGERRVDTGRSPLEYPIRLLQRVEAMGVRDLHANRSDALNSFLPFLENERSSISVVASSFLGVLRVAAEKISAILKDRVEAGVEFKILMTDPDRSAWRETQEGRATSTIRQEIRESVKTLRSWGVKDESIRFYDGAPTIFLLFTPERMLANPYTYQTEAFKTATFELAPTATVLRKKSKISTQSRCHNVTSAQDAPHGFLRTCGPQKLHPAVFSTPCNVVTFWSPGVLASIPSLESR